MFRLPIRRFRVEDDSMEPSLRPGDYVLVNALSYTLWRPKERDVVVFGLKDKNLVKRVVKVFKESCYVVGDNKKNSLDSRKFGPLPFKKIIGKVILRIH